MNKELYIRNKLNTFNQIELLDYYDELDLDKKEELLDELYNLDLNLINNLYINSFKDTPTYNKIEPLPIIKKEELSSLDVINYDNCGKNILLNNEYAIIILAGGSGTRLKYDKPKGTYIFNYKNKKTSLYEIYFNKIRDINNKYNISIPVYIMVSDNNYDDTLFFLEEHDYFGIENVKLFIQDSLPLVDINGKIVLKKKHSIYKTPNGNGNVFKSLKTSGYLDELIHNGIKWIYITGIDNILNNLADITFIGATALNYYKLSSKTMEVNEFDKTNYVYALKDNKVSMITTNELTKDIFNKKKNNKYLYRQNNTLMHLISIEELIKYSEITLPYHRTYKNYKYFNNEEKVFKFEQFIFDAFFLTSTMLCFEINKEKEMYTIKSKEDIELLNK